LGLLALAACLSIFSPVLMAGPIGSGVQWLYTVTGTIGMAVGILGSLGLLVHRLTDPGLKRYTTRGDIINLLFFIVTFVLVSAGCLLRSASAPSLLAVSKGLLRFDAGVEIPSLLATGLFLASVLVVYIPMTHMSHFIAKYFAYHSVRWDDSPNRRGGKLEAKVAECLSYKPTWAAMHIAADGKKTWAEIAETNPALEQKK
jgi:nitrate reductase gamma subunit